jgi:hypothetical protein
MDEFIARLRQDFPAFTFTAGKQFRWSGKTQEITYDPVAKAPTGLWALLHELGHGLLEHQEYRTDIGLLKLEVAAWVKAQELAVRYKLEIDEEHIEHCLDSYRDWLHQRSTCPVCGTHSLQQITGEYACYNCQASWQVTRSRFCRPYRRLAAEKV